VECRNLDDELMEDLRQSQPDWLVEGSRDSILYWLYVDTRALAYSARLAGKIAEAAVHERFMEQLYGQLSTEMRW
jgi:hypothetical protein